MMNMESIGWIISMISVLILVAKFYLDRMQEAKNSTTVDALQNERIIELTGRINNLEARQSEIMNMVTVHEKKTSFEFNKLESKIDRMMEILLKISKQ
jgi:hypothetical protein